MASRTAADASASTVAPAGVAASSARSAATRRAASPCRLLAVETQVARVVELGHRLAALGEAARDLVDRRGGRAREPRVAADPAA